MIAALALAAIHILPARLALDLALFVVVWSGQQLPSSSAAMTPPKRPLMALRRDMPAAMALARSSNWRPCMGVLQVERIEGSGSRHGVAGADVVLAS